MKRILRLATVAVGLVMLGGVAQAQAVAQPKPPAHPYTKRHLYDEQADQAALVSAGLKQAKAEHKRVILDFGGDWCGDCQVLDIYFHDEQNAALLEKNFVVVHLFVATTEDNDLPLAAKYGISPGKGVPALAVLNAEGKVLYSQKTGEFRDMRYMDVSSVHEFLNKWKA